MGGQGSRCQFGLASCPASGVSTSSSPPAPSESCRFSLPAGGNTPPGRRGGGERGVRGAETLQTSHSGRNGGPALGVFKVRRRVRGCLTLVFADSYMSPSTFRAYATRFSIRRSFSAAGSGVGKMACTLLRKRAQKTQGG